MESRAAKDPTGSALSEMPPPLPDHMAAGKSQQELTSCVPGAGSMANL